MFREHAVIFGTGGLAKELVAYLEDGCITQPEPRGLPSTTWRYKIVGAVSTERWDNPDYDWCPVWDDIRGIDLSTVACFLAVADPATKRKIVSRFQSLPWQTYIHPTCTVSAYAKIGRGCLLAPQTILTGDCKLGDFVFLNTNATVGHDSTIGNFATLFPNTEVCGNCDIGEDCVFGIGAYAIPHVSMVAGAKASAGAVVRKPVLEPVTVYGDPAKPKRLV